MLFCMKPIIDCIKEVYVSKRRIDWNHSARGLYLFYMVKYKNREGEEEWSYNMSDELKYEPVISAELGFKTEEAFKKFVFSCFTRQKKEIVKEYEDWGATDVDVICSPKYILRPQLDGANMKQWMGRVFDDSNKLVRNTNELQLAGEYEGYARKFDKRVEEINKRVEEIKKKYEEEERIRSQKEWEKYRADQERIMKEREEFKKQHADEMYYRIYGWPWDRKDNWAGD